jgi:tetratricopeptide (TPR) repeat protein
MSGKPAVSLFGVMFDAGSFWFVFAGFMLMLLVALNIRSEKRAYILLWGVIFSSLTLLVFQSIHLFLPDSLSLGILSGKTDNIFGSWNSLGLFSGFAVLMYLLLVEFFPVAQWGKILLQIFILLALLITAAVNFSLAWILLGALSLIIFVYKASVSLHKKGDEDAQHRPFPITSFVVVIISLVFLTSGPLVGSFLPDLLGISNTEVGPSLSATYSIGKNVIGEKPLLGIGPNRFNEAWAKYKPANINSTPFWDVEFGAGSGLIPTFAATTGILGVLAWLLFLIAFLAAGCRSIFSGARNAINWQIMATFVLSLYLLFALLFYAAGAATFFLFLAFAGAFIGLSATNQGKEITMSFLNDHRKSFVSILALIILAIFSIALAFRYMERFISIYHLRSALGASEVSQAETSINKALAMNYNDLYLRTYSQVYLVKLNSLVTSGTPLSEEDKAELQKIFDQAVRSAELAVEYNGANYQNFRLLGLVYETAGNLGVKDAYPKAIVAYQNAARLNPLNPALEISIARATAGQGKIKEAITYAEAAKALAPNDQSITDYINSLKNKISAPPAPPVHEEKPVI